MKLVEGVGINDNHPTTHVIDGVKIRCPIYYRWKGMLNRCYNETSLKRRPTYRGCSVHPDWLIFGNFKRWFESQYWIDKELDKDLICEDNKVYGPETCVLVSSRVNAFVVSSLRKKDVGLPAGVTMLPSGSYRAAGTDIDGKVVYLGSGSLEKATSLVVNHKSNMAIMIAEKESDQFISELIIRKFVKGEFRGRSN